MEQKNDGSYGCLVLGLAIFGIAIFTTITGLLLQGKSFVLEDEGENLDSLKGAFLIAIICVVIYLVTTYGPKKEEDTEQQVEVEPHSVPSQTGYFAPNKIKKLAAGGYVRNTANCIDILIFREDFSVDRSYKLKDNSIQNKFAFNENLKLTMIEKENRGMYEFDNVKNELKITYNYSRDKKFMRCKLRESGTLVVNYFIFDLNTKKYMKQVLEYNFNESIRYWILDEINPKTGKPIFPFDY